MKKILESRWIQELIILVFSFVLFTMNDWMLVSSWANLWKGGCYFLILYTHAQLNRAFLLPVLLKQHKPLLYAMASILLTLVFSAILYGVSTAWLYKNCYLYKSIKQDNYWFYVATMIATFICIMGPVLLLQFYRDQKKQASETLLFNSMQLTSLRNQLNPHFLFNTFNTLYGISLQYPHRVSELIMQVAQLMRYQMESNGKQCVLLTDELAFIESYIGLEKERVGHRCEIKYETSIGGTKPYKISPMLLIAFVENAFKHGSGTIEACFVHITITVKDAELYLQVRNSIPKKKQEVTSTKIGITNTIKRLDILYEDRYTLDIKQDGPEYIVNLKLQLKDA